MNSLRWLALERPAPHNEDATFLEEINMKNWIIALLMGLTAGAAMEASAQKIDTAKSVVKWTGYGVGKSHWGYVKLASAALQFDKSKNPLSGEVVVDLTSIQTKDIEGEWAAKLDAHLKSADFFDVEKFPTATFKTSSIQKAKDGSFKVDGDLTIKGKTEKLSVSMKQIEEEKQKYLVGAFKFDRSKFDVKYNSESFFDVAKLGDKLIKNDIDLELKLALQD
jgi:polyisoprenoid-binding protein YceI